MVRTVDEEREISRVKKRCQSPSPPAGVRIQHAPKIDSIALFEGNLNS